jgi:hypothetical protein
MIGKRAITNNNYEAFLSIIVQQAHHMGIMANKDVATAVNLLVERLQGVVFDAEHPKKSKDTDTKAFIVIFKRKYLQMIDWEYTAKVRAHEIKSIRNVIKKLEGLYHDVAEYLDWFFDVFLEKNKKLCPPSIGLCCSEFVMSTFCYEHTGEIKRRQERALRETEEGDILNKARMLYRKTKSGEVRSLLKDYDSARVNLKELKDGLNEFEEKLNKGEVS